MTHYASVAALFGTAIRGHLGHHDFPRVTIDLEYDAVLPLRDSRGLKVLCLDGVVWITEHEHRHDVVLEPGGVYQLSRNGTSLVLALHTARIALEAPALTYKPLSLSRVVAKAKAFWSTRRVVTPRPAD